MSIEIVPAEAEAHMDWLALTDALLAGHAKPKATLEDTFLYRDDDTLLSRAAWIDGMGIAVKSATIFPGNPAKGLPQVNGGVSLFDDSTGALEALVDFHLVTKWKTAGDSLLGARLLARPESKTILIVGAGTVARSLREAYGAGFPDARFLVWNRTADKAEALAAAFPDTEHVWNLEAAFAEADIVTCATSGGVPVVKGDWLNPGQHLDLIGAFRPDMRETDDTALTRSRVFVDSRETTMGHIGELKIPLEAGVIAPDDIEGDFYDLAAAAPERAPDDITLFKNGGGAHLDLMTARYVLDAWRGR